MSKKKKKTKQRWKEKRMYGQSVREMPESTDVKKTWKWRRKADLKIKQSHLCAAQEQSL